MKEVKIILKLNNYNEVKYLLSKGVKYGENGIVVTHSKHSGKTWFITTSWNNLRLLNEYRNLTSSSKEKLNKRK